MTFYVPFGCPRHYGHQTMVKHHHSQGTSSFWVPVWRRQLFGQEPLDHMHDFRVCLFHVLVPSFTSGAFELLRTQFCRWNLLGVAHW